MECGQWYGFLASSCICGAGTNEVMDWVQSVHSMQLHRARILCPPHTNCHNCGPEEYNFWTIVQLGAVLCNYSFISLASSEHDTGHCHCGQ